MEDGLSIAAVSLLSRPARTPGSPLIASYGHAPFFTKHFYCHSLCRHAADITLNNSPIALVNYLDDAGILHLHAEN